MAETAASQGHRGTRAIQRLVEFAPSTGGLALWVKHLDGPAEPGLPQRPPWATTDGQTIRYAPGFERLPVAEQAGWVAHEVLHIALRHAPRFLDLQRLLGDADLSLFNTCADAIVNSALGHLGWLQLPPTVVTLERLLASTLGVEQTAESALLEWDVERLYRAIDDRRAGGAGGRRADGPRSSRARALHDGAQADLRPAERADEPPEAQAGEAREWQESLLRAHAGDGAFSMLRTLLADLPRCRTPWEQVLRTQLARALSARRGVSWSRPSRSYIANQGRVGAHRRMPWEPGFGATVSVPRLVVMVDVSGSIDAGLLARFSAEITAITRRLECGGVLVVGDDRVRRVVAFEPGRFDLAGLAFAGGEGTDFTPLLAEADRHRPDIGVFLTDLDGPASWRPRWPVLWAVPEAQGHVEPPFGRKLVLT